MGFDGPIPWRWLAVLVLSAHFCLEAWVVCWVFWLVRKGDAWENPIAGDGNDSSRWGCISMFWRDCELWYWMYRLSAMLS